MSKPQAYEPIQGQRYQLLFLAYGQTSYDHLDYAKDRTEKSELLNEYNMMNLGGTIKTIELPRKYWKEVNA